MRQADRYSRQQVEAGEANFHELGTTLANGSDSWTDFEGWRERANVARERCGVTRDLAIKRTCRGEPPLRLLDPELADFQAGPHIFLHIAQGTTVHDPYESSTH